MKLPKRDLPQYEDTLPVSSLSYVFRPYTVKEERILMMAATAGPRDKIMAIKQLVENCTGLDASKLHPTDLEWVFLQLRKTSVTSTVELKYNVKDECGFDPNTMAGTCPAEIMTGFDIGNAEVKSLGELEKLAKPAKGGGWLLELFDGVYLHLEFVTPDGKSNILYSMLKSVIDGDNIIDKSEFTEDEFINFIDELPPAILNKVVEFASATPYTSARVQARCKVCKKTFEYEAKGLINFLV